jgi:hypothetical protein
LHVFCFPKAKYLTFMKVYLRHESFSKAHKRSFKFVARDMS